METNKEILLKTKKDKKQFTKWLKALRSDKYSQTTGTLQDGKGYCCLGVACKVLIPKAKQKLFGGFLAGTMPNSVQSDAPEWLKNISADFATKSRSGSAIVELNDEKEYTFKQIANRLERVYKKELEA